MLDQKNFCGKLTFEIDIDPLLEKYHVLNKYFVIYYKLALEV